MGCVEAQPADSSVPTVVFESEAAAWRAGGPDDDPLAAHRPVDDGCPSGSWSVEGEVLEVESGPCHYAWFLQPLSSALAAGDVLRFDLWHTGLDAPELGEAHAALLVGPKLVWEGTAPIPDEPRLWSAEVILDEPVPHGEFIGLHLHNHGDNVWKLGPVVVLSAP